jgi:cyclic pyranopterin phosphate synthase
MDSMQDPYGRQIDYLRISVTDRCNLRCIYCMPSKGVLPFESKNILTYEEIVRVVRPAVGLGVRKIRITGGEPLMRKDLHRLIESLNRIEGIEDISLTTNGTLLKRLAPSLADAGLKRVNVSLDSLDPEKYGRIRRNGDLSDVLEGIQAADLAELRPVKINMVVIRGVNDDEIEAFARLTLKNPYHVRFIEIMPFGSGGFWRDDKCIPVHEMMGRIQAAGPLEPVDTAWPGPAEYFRLEGARSLVGFISPMTRHFCTACNRLRLTSDGKLRPCLFSNREIDVKSALRRHASDREIAKLLKLSIQWKPEGHAMDSSENSDHLKSMSQIGG